MIGLETSWPVDGLSSLPFGYLPCSLILSVTQLTTVILMAEIPLGPKIRREFFEGHSASRIARSTADV
jgi:hypothetical protein